MKYIYLIVLISFSTFAQKPLKDSPYKAILSLFEEWKEKQFASGEFARPGNCHPGLHSDNEDYNGPDMGLPDEFKVIYTDINLDEKTDALITFYPIQCDGGNASMNWQMRLLVLSGKKGYFIDDTSIEKLEEEADKGWIIIDDAGGNAIYGTYYEYADDDGRCCPSIHKDFVIFPETWEISYRDGD